MKYLVAMSGGVDSSVAARLLIEAGNDCIGCTMKLFDNPDAGVPQTHTCCSLEDVEDARAVARRLGIPHYVFNFSPDFRRQVIERFADSYMRGITPNPCIDCNRYIKFDKLFTRAAILGCDAVATGHYARIRYEGGKYQLLRGADVTKDQSYVLYMLTQHQLAHISFPLGELRKSEVRAIADEEVFVNAGKPDSQDICFVPDGDYARVVQLHSATAAEPGNFITTDGRVIGRHRGIIHYTIGQHRGLGAELAGRTPGKLFVCAVCPENNTVVLGSEADLYVRQADICDVNWISGEIPQGRVRCQVRTRYRQPEQWAVVTPGSNGKAHIVFDAPQRAVTPGQAAVMYDGDVVLGGGTVVRLDN